MYLDYFSLEKFPFRITPDPSLFFPGGADGRGVVLDALIYAITSGEGILKVVGEVGSGKTMLCRMLGGRLSESVEIVYLANPNLSARDIIFAIAFELELDVESSTDRLLVMHKLQDYLLKKHSEGGTVVVFIEEAQSMPLEALEEIRLLSNLETHQHKLMQLVLFGQPELDRKLQKKSIRQLRERITHSFNLEPLSVDSTRDYLRFRLQAAGCPWPQLFSPAAEKKLAKAAMGLTRRINILADKAMMAAYADSSVRQEPRDSVGQIQSMVLPRHVKAAIRDSGYNSNLTSLLRYVGMGLAAAVVIALLASFINRVDFSFELFSKLEVAMPTPASIESSGQITRVIEPFVPAEEPEIVVEVAEQVIPPQPVEINLVTDNLEANVEPAELSEPVIPPGGELEVEFTEAADLPVLEAPVVTAEEVLAEDEGGQVDELESEITTVIISEPAETIAERPEQNAIEASTEQATQPLITTTLTVPEPEQSNPVPAVSAEPIRAPSDNLFADIGLVALRGHLTPAWLENLAEGDDYTLQLISVSRNGRDSLEEFLQFLSIAGLLDSTYVCAISATSRSPAQWAVLHGEFSGVTMARNYINQLPVHLRRYEPFIRNTNDIACLVESE